MLQQEKPVVALLSALHGLWVDSAYAQGGTEAIYFFINDHLGMPQKMVDESGVVVWDSDYNPFGEVGVTTSTYDNKFRFPGQYWDEETGLHYNWHRYYDPKTGRYLRADPVGQVGGLNLFAYVHNNPVSFMDLLGLAQFGKRPFFSLPGWLVWGPGTNPLDDALNTELVHEQIFFEDGKEPSNLGLFGDSGIFNEPGVVRPDSPENLKEYRMYGPHYDDALLREAVQNIGAGNYSLVDSNCQDWADKVRQEYERLAREKLERECK